MARVLVGVSGGIAAYKAAELVRLLGGAGHSVRVVQTPSSTRFVGRATFEGITGAPVLVEEWEGDPARGAFPGEPPPDHDPISHLELVRRCDALVLAPASANTLAKLATGQADNLLTSAALANTSPLVLAPAMNSLMWEHPATRANAATLAARGAVIVGPETGELASRGEWGAGRLAEPSAIHAAVEGVLTRRSVSSFLSGLSVLVTAGGTREPIDAVRYVGNRSSGRMGFALAREAARRGARVTVVAANVGLPRQEGIDYVDVETAGELEAATREGFRDAQVLVMAAAVSDFRPVAPERSKLAKRDRAQLTVELEPTTDVLAALSTERRAGQTLVGFAAEHGDGALDRARDKLARKGLDAVVLNDISRPGVGFDVPDNEVTILTEAGAHAVPRGSKDEIARVVVDAIEALRGAEPGEPDSRIRAA